MNVRRGGVRQPFLHQLARGLHLGAPVRAVERAEIDHHHGVAAEPFGQVTSRWTAT